MVVIDKILIFYFIPIIYLILIGFYIHRKTKNTKYPDGVGKFFNSSFPAPKGKLLYSEIKKQYISEYKTDMVDTCQEKIISPASFFYLSNPRRSYSF